MLRYMLDPSDKDRAFLELNKSDDTVLLVNNLGGVSPLEMGGITAEVVNQLEQSYSIKPVRILSGTYMTSLNGLGFSISLLKLTDPKLLELLDAPAEATGWTAPIKSSTWTNPPTQTSTTERSKDATNKPANLTIDPSKTTKALRHALESLIAAEPDVTRYDTVVGDGDCGIGLKRGAQGILKALDSNQTDAALYLDSIISTVETDMDGTSGALYAIFLNALAFGLRSQNKTPNPEPATPKTWAQALRSASESLARYTPAKPGDRTLVDALAPFVEELAGSGEVGKAAAAAKEGAAKTKGMKASLGRTVYVGGSGFEEVPDPGAHGLAVFLEGLAEGLAEGLK
jgi:dihydroxyacetone kinase